MVTLGRTAMLLALFAVSSAASGQLCSIPPFAERQAIGGSLQFQQSVDGCQLVASLDSASTAAAATVHFRRRNGKMPLRASFRIDLVNLVNQDLTQGVSLLTAVSRDSAPTSEGRVAEFVNLNVLGNMTGTSRFLAIRAACSTAPHGYCLAASPLPGPAPIIGFELSVGAGSGGSLRWWINQGFDQPPAGELVNLDNAFLDAVERVSLGLSSPSAGYLQAFQGSEVLFDQIEVDDDQIAWNTHEIQGLANCPVGVPILANGVPVSDSTCGGTQWLPSLASGATWAPTPERMYSVVLPLPGGFKPQLLQLVSATPAINAVLCDTYCGPAGRCHAVGAIGAPMALDDLPAGNYMLVVKAVGAPSGTCGAYTLAFNTPLD